MQVNVYFHSYFKDLAGCEATVESMPLGAKLSDLEDSVWKRFPALGPMRRSMLAAVGVAYQEKSYLLREGDEVSFFPPVQGG